MQSTLRSKWEGKALSFSGSPEPDASQANLPTLCVRSHRRVKRKFAERKEWGTHGMVESMICQK